jgi:hypothetical protein
VIFHLRQAFENSLEKAGQDICITTSGRSRANNSAHYLADLSAENFDALIPRINAQFLVLERLILTFATISHDEKMPIIAMAQIATNFLLLTIYLSHLVGQLGGKRGPASPT